MLVSDVRFYISLLAYLTVGAGIVLFAIAYVWNDPDFEDEKSMSTIIFIVIAFVEILGSVLILGVWQQHQVRVEYYATSRS